MASGKAGATGGARRVRTLFLSDLHLGFRRVRVRELNDFLAQVEAETIVLAGDIIDALSLARRVFWSDGHTQVLRTLLARQRSGTRLVYLPGNHDAALSVLADMLHGQLEVHREWVHRTARGERMLVLHGDRFDGALGGPPWLTRLGDTLYYVSVGASHAVNDLRRALGRPYWPLAERIKLSLATSVRYIARFEQLAAEHARAQGYDGVVCGHIHRANLRRIEGTLYCNSGDWVESCSAVVETCSGELELLRWPEGARVARRAAAGFLADAA
jgi:UDP-2,3-diacylglucosamine pyrophosphatase LpxH